MRILFVTPSYYPIIGGSEALTRNLSIKLNERGIDADIMTFNMNKKWNPIWKEEVLGDGLARVFRIPAFNPFPCLPNPLYPLFRINVVPKPTFIRRFRHYDIIHFIGEADLGFHFFSYLTRRPKIMHCVGIYRGGGIYYYYNYKRPFLGNIFKRYFRRLADIYIVYSEEEKNLLLDLGIPKCRYYLLPLGIDVNKFRPDETRRIDNYLLFVGRIYEVKGLHILMEALSHLRIPIQLGIIGPRWDEEYTNRIEQMAHSINEKGVHNVELLGPMGQDGLVPMYQKAAVIVCPYLYETYSYVTLEALACGTPVVSTGSHISKQGSDGIVVTPRDPRKLAKAIEKLLEDKEMRERYARDGRRFVEQHFSWEAIITKLVRLYEKMLDSYHQKKTPEKKIK